MHKFEICYMPSIGLKIFQTICRNAIMKLMNRCQSNVWNPASDFIMRMDYSCWQHSGYLARCQRAIRAREPGWLVVLLRVQC